MRSNYQTVPRDQHFSVITIDRGSATLMHHGPIMCAITPTSFQDTSVLQVFAIVSMP